MKKTLLSLLAIFIFAIFVFNFLTPIKPPNEAVPGATNQSKLFGYIRTISEQNNQPTLSLDEATMLTGEAAKKTAIQDNVCPKENPDCLDTDYYIRNLNQETRVFPISPTIEITMATYKTDQGNTAKSSQKITFEQLKKIYTGEDKPREYLKEVPYTLELDSNGNISKITEQYLP